MHLPDELYSHSKVESGKQVNGCVVTPVVIDDCENDILGESDIV